MPELPKQHVQINAIKPPEAGQVDYYGSGKDAGLMLRVSHTGRKTWFVRYWTYRKGKETRAKKTIGRYPGIDLKDAREEKTSIFARVDKGEDPAKDDKTHKRKNSIKTIDELITVFFEERETEKYRGRVRRNVNDERSMTKCYITPVIGSYAPHTVTNDDIDEVLSKAQETCSGIRANRVLALMRVLFKYALSKKYIDLNPTEGIEPPAKENIREIDPPQKHELKELWNLIENGKRDSSNNPAQISKQIQLVLENSLVSLLRELLSIRLIIFLWSEIK